MVERKKNKFEKMDKDELVKLAQNLTIDLENKNKKLEDIENQVERIFNNSSIGVFRYIPEGFNWEFNQKFVEILGYNHRDELIKDVSKLWALVSSTKRVELLDYLKKHNKIEEYETKIKLVNGEEKWISLSAYSTLNNGKNAFEGFIQDVTAKKEYEKELKTLNNRLLLAADAAKIGIWEFNIVTNDFIWDDNMYKMYGVENTGNICTYDVWSNSLHNDDKKPTEEKVHIAITQRKKYYAKFRIMTPKGEQRIIEAHGLIGSYDENNKPLNLIGINIDITNEETAKIKLAASEDKYRKIFDDANDAIVIFEKDVLRIYDFNSKALELFGYSFDELKRLSFLDLYNSGLKEHEKSKFIKEIENEKIERSKISLAKKTGETIPAEISISHITIDNKDHLLGIIRDLTETNNLIEELQREHDLYSSILHTSIDGFWLIDRDGHLIDHNESARKMLGFEQNELNGMHISNLDVNENFEDTKEHINKISTSGLDRFLTKHKKKDGQSIDVEVSTAVLKGHFRGKFVAFTRDVTEITKNRQIMERRIALNEFSRNHSVDEVMQKTLDYAEELTESSIGFWHHLADDQEYLILQQWSTNTINTMCNANGKGLHYNISEAGVWVDCVKFGKPVIHNDYENLEYKKGMPKGHAKVVRELVVPIFKNGIITAIMGVGNKKENYIDGDIKILQLFGEVAWEIYERKIAQEALEKSEEKNKAIVNMIPDLVIELNSDGIIVDHFANEESFNKTEFRNKPIESVYPQNVAELFKNKIKEVLLTGELNSFEFSLINNGKINYYEARMVKSDENGVMTFIRDITQSKEISNRVIESEEKFSKAFYSSPMIKIISEIETGNVIEINSSFLSKTKFCRNEIIGSNFVELGIMTEESNKEIKKAVYLDGIIRNKKISLGKKDGSQFICNLNVDIITVSGSPVMLTVAEDITDRRSAELALEHSEKKFRNLVLNLPGTVYLALNDQNYTLFYISESVIRLTGYASNEFLAEDVAFRTITHPDDREYISKKINAAVNEQRQYNLKYRIFDKSDNLRWVHEIGNGVFEKGKLKYLEGYITDITEIYLSEQKLMESQLRFKKILETIPMLVIFLSANAELEYVNEYFIEFTGWKKEEVIGKNWIDNFISAVEKDEIKAIMKNAVDNDNVAIVHINEILLKNGETRIIQWNNSKLDTIDTSEKLFISIGSDVSEQQLSNLISENVINYVLEIDKKPDLLSVLKYTLQFIMNLTGCKTSWLFKQNSNGRLEKIITENEYLNSDAEKFAKIENEFNKIMLRFGNEGELTINKLSETEAAEYEHLILNEFAIVKISYQDHTPVVIILNSNTKECILDKQKVMVHRLMENLSSQIFNSVVNNEIKESQYRYKVLFESMINGFALHRIIYDDNGKAIDYKFLEINPAFEKLTGIIAEEAIGKTVMQLMPETEDYWLKTYAEIVRTGESKTFQNYSREIGRYFEVHSFKAGEEQFATIIADVTEKTIWLNNLKKLSRAVQQSPVSIVITDKDGNIEYVNPKFTAATGYSYEETIGQNPRMLKSGEQSESFYKEMWYTISAGKEWTGIFHNKKKNGELFWESGIIAPLLNDENEIINYVAVKEDITVKKKNEEELNTYRENLENMVNDRTRELSVVNKKLEKEIAKTKKAEKSAWAALEKEQELNDMKTQFVSMASHEFRTPLTTIQSSADLIEMYSQKGNNEKIQTHVGRILNSIKKVTVLLDEVLTISRGEKGKIKYEPTKNNLPEFLEKVLNDVVDYKKSGQTIDIQNNFPDEEAVFDPNLIIHILSNLLTNSIKYSFENSTIILRVAEKENMIEFIVEDNGPGINEDDKINIYEPFYRGTNSISIEGSGLGLSIVKKFVEVHKGKIFFNSGKNEGTVFHILISKEG